MTPIRQWVVRAIARYSQKSNVRFPADSDTGPWLEAAALAKAQVQRAADMSNVEFSHELVVALQVHAIRRAVAPAEGDDPCVVHQGGASAAGEGLMAYEDRALLGLTLEKGRSNKSKVYIGYDTLYPTYQDQQDFQASDRS